MVLEYFNIRKGKHADVKDANKSPILNEEDEQFLHKITSDDNPPPLPERPVIILDNGKKVNGKDAQDALMDGADKIPLPTSPPIEGELKEGNVVDPTEEKKRRDYWSFVPSMSKLRLAKSPKEQTASDLQAAVDASKKGENVKVEGVDATEAEGKREEDELTAVLDQLNLSAANNRVFSFSKESQKLMEEFTLILKDLVNGVPTAYDDLEKLLTRSEGQLTKMFAGMPPFLQTLVKSLPAKMTSTLGPEFLAATSEKPGADAKAAGIKTSSTDKKKHKKSRIPSLKSLVSQQGTVAALLRSILNFLKLRFPAFMTGTNVLMSLAVFLLLFVFWYCHKRGKETRLEKERLAAGDAASDLESSISGSDLEDSAILDRSTGKTEPPIILRNDPGLDEKPSGAVQDLPDVFSQPAPAEVPLPSSEVDKGLISPSGKE